MPIVEIDDLTCEKILHGELLDANLFENKDITIMQHEDKIAALYTPFNDKFYKPEKVLL